MSIRTLVQSDQAPAAIGPYSQAVTANGLVYTAGVIPLDPESMELVGTTIQQQTERVMKSLEALLGDAGTGLGSVITTTCFLSDLGDFAAFNEVYATYFTDAKSPRSERKQVVLITLPRPD